MTVIGGKGGVDPVGIYYLVQLNDDFSESGENVKFEIEMPHSHYALNRTSHDHWNTDFFVLEFGIKGIPQTLFQAALFQDKTALRTGIITQGGLYDFTHDRWEGGQDGSTPCMLSIEGDYLFFKVSRASVDEEDAIDWMDVLSLSQTTSGVRTTLLLFIKY